MKNLLKITILGLTLLSLTACPEGNYNPLDEIKLEASSTYINVYDIEYAGVYNVPKKIIQTGGFVAIGWASLDFTNNFRFCYKSDGNNFILKGTVLPGEDCATMYLYASEEFLSLKSTDQIVLSINTDVYVEAMVTFNAVYPKIPSTVPGLGL